MLRSAHALHTHTHTAPARLPVSLCHCCPPPLSVSVPFIVVVKFEGDMLRRGHAFGVFFVVHEGRGVAIVCHADDFTLGREEAVL